MEIGNSKMIQLSINDIPNLSTVVRKKGIWFKKMMLEYRKQSKMLLVRFEGSKNMKLSENYLRMVENQLKKLHLGLISPLIKNVRTNFTISISVNAQGQFSLMDADLKIKVDCGRGINMHDSFREPFKVLLPFALYITNLEFRGHNHKISVVEADLKITAEDLIEIVDYPIVAPVAREKWYNIASFVYEEAKEEYRYEVSIPCVEGELFWDNKISTIQMTLFEKKSMSRIN